MKTNIDFKIDKDTAVHVPTKKLANKINKLLDMLGATRWDGGGYLDDQWQVYKENTCYDINLGKIGHIEYYTKLGYDIITAEDFLKLHEVENRIDVTIDNNTAVCMETKEEARKLYHLINLLYSEYNDTSVLYQIYYYWHLRNEPTCYHISKDTLGSLKDAKKHGYKVIFAKDLLNYVLNKTNILTHKSI